MSLAGSGFSTNERELAVLLRIGCVEAILLAERNHHFVDERHAEPRHLHPAAELVLVVVVDEAQPFAAASSSRRR